MEHWIIFKNLQIKSSDIIKGQIFGTLDHFQNFTDYIKWYHKGLSGSLEHWIIFKTLQIISSDIIKGWIFGTLDHFQKSTDYIKLYHEGLDLWNIGSFSKLYRLYQVVSYRAGSLEYWIIFWNLQIISSDIIMGWIFGTLDHFQKSTDYIKW